MTTNLDELKLEADKLGIKYNANIGIEKLQEKINKFNEDDNGAAGSMELKETKTPELTGLAKTVAKAKEAAFKTRRVTITNLDKRENEHTTTCYLGFENLYFDLSKIVPLDVPVELEQGLINVAKEVEMTIHIAETDSQGKLTGNKIPKRVKKYAINYHQEGE
jgi:hypothetical protein